MNESISFDSIKKLVEKQKMYFNSGTCKSIKFRIEQLKKLQKMINSNEKNLLAALKSDLGKSEAEGYLTEIGFVATEINYMMRKLPEFSRPAKVRTSLAYLGARSYIYSDPLGMVLIIGPWNYPFHLLMAPLVGSIAGGNCSILKPSEYAPNTSELIHNLVKDTFNEEYIAVVEGGIPQSTALLHNRFDHIFFTGSPSVGKIVMESAAQNLTPVTLELGGKSPCIIDKDINIEYTARRIIFGKFLNAGQTCVAPDYLFVHHDIKDKLLERLTQVIREFYSTPRESLDYARIINKQHFRRLTNLLQEGNIVCGGDYEEENLYIAPTIIDDISPDARLMQEEIFGPILPVMEYENLQQAINFVNSKPKPLALYFFSRDKRLQNSILDGTSSGGVCLNDTLSHITTKYLPFGGIGQSGTGNYHGRASFDRFVHKKSVLKQSFIYDLHAKYPPYKIPLSLIKRMLKLL
ncbi:MAG: aldehyde dehydrogenase [Syntrophomonadaceae bacterium]|nr:aldehyde dehydrogenase [Syntrophomonadaceae bacterium]MDD4549032.1 aldehyde dehydrogenase [Syntrophomonadaceae bacterium]